MDYKIKNFNVLMALKKRFSERIGGEVNCFTDHYPEPDWEWTKPIKVFEDTISDVMEDFPKEFRFEGKKHVRYGLAIMFLVNFNENSEIQDWANTLDPEGEWKKWVQDALMALSK